MALRDPRDLSASAAERFESFAVTHSSNPDGFLGLNIDLASVPEMRDVVTSARQLPGSVILGPAFIGDNGKTVALLATSSDLNGGDGVMAATINLHDFFRIPWAKPIAARHNRPFNRERNGIHSESDEQGCHWRG